jgi:hypothetical protein
MPSEPALLATPLRVPADSSSDSPFKYTYIEIGATTLNVDDIQGSDEDVDSYYLRAQIAFLGFLYLYGGYENQSLDFQDTDTDLFRLGAGVHFNVLPKLDLVGEAGYLNSDTSSDLSNLDDTTDGFEAYAGARWMTVQWEGGGLELDGGATYVDLKNRLASHDESVGGKAGARVHFLKLFSVGADYTFWEDDDQLSANLRVSF